MKRVVVLGFVVAGSIFGASPAAADLAVAGYGEIAFGEQSAVGGLESEFADGRTHARFAGGLRDDLACDVLCTELLSSRGYDFDSGYPPVITGCTLKFDAQGPERPIVHVTYFIPEHCAGGRRPAGPCATPMHATDPAARWLAGVAHLEAISVTAFIELARELRLHNAPASFSRRALLAAADEVDHAAAVAALARQSGAVLAVPRVSRRADRTLFELAKTNAVEGCIRELDGALVANWQGEHATSSEMRSVFAAIASDELRHAELAYDIHRWAIALLTEDQRQEIATAQRLACEAIEADISSDLDVLNKLGLPEPDSARELARVVARVAAPLFAT